MAINFKPINEVPEITEMPEGAKVLVNADGTAMQIDASLVGGKGGGTVVYLKDFTTNDTTATVSPCFDAEMTQVMTQDEFLEAYAAGPMMLHIDTGDGQLAYIHPCCTVATGTQIMSILYMGAEIQLVYTFADATA